MNQRASREQGFGMVVVAMLFTAFAIIAAMMLDRDAVKADILRQQQVEAQLTRLNVALMQYVRFNADRFPCPASYLELPTSATFGAAAAADCRTVVPAGTVVATSSNNKLLMGMVPVQALVPYGINYSDAFDAYGSRIIYAVHRDLTTGASAGDITAAANGDRAAISDYLTADVMAPPPDAILISYGRDRMGARLRNQAVLTTPSIACASAGQNRYLNCDGDRSFIRGPLFTSTSAAVAAYFDDTISAIRYF